ncbi:hypothetical protein J6590_060446 [Homalodisca vitripennis]|nr:hypothetical protein J6590_060446 [Homalodisca vitripennis]
MRPLVSDAVSDLTPGIWSQRFKLINPFCHSYVISAQAPPVVYHQNTPMEDLNLIKDPLRDSERRPQNELDLAKIEN